MTSAKNRLHHIHARAGLRQDKLHHALGRELRTIWGIAEDASPDRVREIVLLRLNHVLEGFTDPLMPEIVWTAYNVGVDPADAATGMVGRIKRMIEAGKVGVSERTCTRRFRDYLDGLETSLGTPQPPLSDDELRRASAWLAGNLRPGAEVRAPVRNMDGLSAAIRGLREPVPTVVRMFLDGRVCGPVTETGDRIPARLGALGDWFCVFTDDRLLAEYREATGAEWAHVGHSTGREVVLMAADRSEPAGVLVNPSPVRGSGSEAALPLPPEEVVRLALDHWHSLRGQRS